MDARIRELEQRVAAGDAGARENLIAALTRAGRLREVQAAWREELRQLAPKLRLEPALKPRALAHGAEVVAWSSELQGLRVARLDTGEWVHRDRHASIAHLAVGGPWTFFTDVGKRRLVRFHKDGGRDDAPATLSLDARIVSVDPAGERLIVDQGGQPPRLLRWPDLEARPLGGNYTHTVAWEDDLALVADQQRAIAVRLGSGELVTQRLHPRDHWLGKGWTLKLQPGIAAEHFDGRTFTIQPFRVGVQYLGSTPSLSTDQRRLRMAMGSDVLACWEVDLQGATFRGGPADVPGFVGRWQDRTNDLWHPHADVCALMNEAGSYPRSFVLRDVEGELAQPLPPQAWPQRWLDDGHALLVSRPGRGETRLEVWRADGH